MGSDKIRVLIADDQRLILEGLTMVLERDGLEVVGAAMTGRQAVDLTLNLQPEVVLLDIRMPDMDGLQALAGIKAARASTAVIMLSSYRNPDYLARAIALGAAGFLTKDSDPDQIPDAIRTVVAGEAIVDLEMLQAAFSAARGLTHESQDTALFERPTLTDQEHRILMLIAEGLNNDSIADLLSISRNTVKSHVQNIFRKLGVSDRTQAAIWALRRGIVPLGDTDPQNPL